MGDRVEVRFSGFGGQGLVLMGDILGEAAVRAGLWASGADFYGAQARGAASRSELVLSQEPVDFPHVLTADLLVALSQEAYDQFGPQVRSSGLVLCDSPPIQVRQTAPGSPLHLAVPATRTAVDELGARQAANLVALAAAVALTALLPREILTQAMEARVPPRTLEVNRKALEAGFRLGDDLARGLARPLPSFDPRPGAGA